MQAKEAIKFRFKPFKRQFAVEYGDYGMMLEKVGGGICAYATDKTHENIFCACPLGFEKDFKDTNYYFYAIDGERMMLRVRRAVLMIDFAKKICSTNVENFRVFGSPEWGQNCMVPWKESYTRLYNREEKRRLGQLKEEEDVGEHSDTGDTAVEENSKSAEK